MGQKVEKISDKEAGKELEQLVERMYTEMISKNIPVLDRIFSKDFHLRHMSGMIQDKEEFLKAIVDGTLNYFAQVPVVFECSLDGDKAFVRTENRVKAAVFGAGVHTWPLGLELEAEKTRNGWKFTEAKAYAW